MDQSSASTASLAPEDLAAPSCQVPETLRGPIAVADDSLAEIQSLYDQGLLLEAHRAAQSLGDFRHWGSTKSRVLAGRLAAHWGAPRLSSALMILAWRGDQDDPDATYFYALDRLRHRGPYAARLFIRKYGELRGNPAAETLASWYAMRGEIAAMLRDFDQAEAWLERGAEVAPTSPWVQVCQSFTLEQEDRYEEALAAAQNSLKLRSWYRPGIQATAHLLSLLGRDNEALSLLAEASARFENSAITAQLHALQMELKQFEDAATTLERYVQLTPHREKSINQWVAAQRSEIAYHRGDIEGAIFHAQASDSEYFREIARRLEDPARAAARRVLLDVGFVRQHRLTCGPATLAAIGGYWKMPVDHLQVAEAICYDGTPHLSERKWAEENGWVVREFSVTEEATAQLLDRGIPFTFTTVEPANSHLQAVIGYDGRRGTMTIRDPFERHSREGLADKVLERYAPFGPRGMALAPISRRTILEELALPDAPLWDLLHNLDGALEVHRRPQALELLDQMRNMAPDHKLTLEARRHLAIYDGNATEQLAAVESLRTQFPDNARLEMERLALLRNHVRREERLAIYNDLCQRTDSHPIFWQQYAAELRTDARRHDDAVWLLKRAIRRWPLEAWNYYLLAGIYWDQRRFDESTDLYRLAACLDDKNESYASSYFAATVHLKKTDEALAFLQGRFQRLGHKSSSPGTTLAYALIRLERTSEAFDVLNRAIELRPDDGELLLYAADTICSSSLEQMPRSKELLSRAQEKSPPVAWHRTAARLAYADGRPADALDHWREILALQPLAIDAHRGVAQLLAEIEGQAASLAHLQQSADRFPHYQPLVELWAEWVREEPEAVREPVIRRLLAVNPDQAWGCRELALLLVHRREFDEARRFSEMSLRIEPNLPSSLDVHAYVLRLEGRIDEARDYLCRAIRLSVDADYAVSSLLELSPTRDERREALALVKEELERQVIFGDGLLNFRSHARGVLDDDELLTLLREAHAARPDLWHAWSALILQLRDMQRLEEALALARQATDRFPLLPRLWLDRASVERSQGDAAAELASLEAAWRINPRWDTAIRALCDYHERQGNAAQARELLERAAAQNPLDGGLQADLADALWRADQKEAALELIRKTVLLDPGNQYAWNCLNYWSDQLGCPDVAIQAARDLTQTRGGEARSWLILARLLDAPEESEQRLDACHKAIELNPWCLDAYDLKARALETAGRYEEAIAACRPEIYGEHVPSELRARQAWIEADRGNLSTALDLVRAVLHDDPGFYVGWEKMCDWAREAKDNATYLEGAQALVRLRPQFEVPYGYLGEAKIECGDRPGAMEAFSRSLELNPRYEFGGNWLFDLQLEDGKLDDAAATLAILQRHSEGPYVLARGVQLAAARKDLDTALALFRKVCVTPSNTEWTVAGPVESMLNAGWVQHVGAALGAAVDLEDAVPEVGRQWGSVVASQRLCLSAARFLRLLERGDVGNQAIYGYMRRLQGDGQADLIVRFAGEQGWSLRKYTFAWGAIGMALVGIRRYDLAVAWQAGWTGYPEAQPWMLVNVVEALRAYKREDEAREVSRAALALPAGFGQHLHHVWLASDAALAGDLDAVAEHAAHYDQQALDDDYQFQVALIECVVEMRRATGQDLGGTFPAVRRKLAGARKDYKHLDFEPARRRDYRRALLVIARLRGTPFAWLWYLARLLLE